MSTGWRSVLRVSFPQDGDPAIMPLYVDPRETVVNPDAERVSAREDEEEAGDRPRRRSRGVEAGVTARANLSRIGRYSATIPARTRLSFATYFNAFPAAYWRQWTTADSVRLQIELTGTATVDVFRSTINGSLNRVDREVDATGVIQFDLSLKNFGDGGWLWFDIDAGENEVTLARADWLLPASRARRRGSMTIAITTYNRPQDCVAQLRRFAESPDLMQRIDRIIIVDQGSDKVADAEEFDDARSGIGDVLALIEQPNLGGSGGFARGMYETVVSGQSDYVMLLDDDVVVEPGGMLRALDFADYAREPTIVGGHMLNLYQRSVLHTYGERVNLYRSMWESVDPSLDGLNLSVQGLRSKRSLHRRADVAFNGWWMCLIPRTVIERIGLALPVFIKWDDAEYGLRAGAYGVPTVSLPGAAVWHMPWNEKNDLLDWQAYFHQRNRWLVALLYSPYPRGGSLLRESVRTDIKHLMSLQYSAVAMRNRALRDLMIGPAHLHETIGQRAGEIRTLHASFSDGKVLRDISTYPSVRRHRPPARGTDPRAPRNALSTLIRAAAGGARQLLLPTPSERSPEMRVAAPDARWWLLTTVDSALVSTADGSGVTVYRRDRRTFVGLLRESLRLHWRIRRSWSEYSRLYSGALHGLVSLEAWERTFGIAQEPGSDTQDSTPRQ